MLAIFDFDGTLCHTGPGIYKAIEETLNHIGHPSLKYEEVMDCIGGGLHHLLKSLDESFINSEEKVQELTKIFKGEYKKVFLSLSDPYEGIIDFLKNWPHEMAIASNKDEYYLKETVKNSEFNNFDWVAVLGGNSLPEKKPHPMMIDKAIECSNFNQKEAFMVGDSSFDIKSAHAANIPCIAVDFGYSSRESLAEAGADAIISHISELEDSLKKIF